MRILVLAMWLSLGANSDIDEGQARKFYARQNAEIHRLWDRRQYGQALKVLEGLRRHPGVSRLRDKRIDVLYNLACAYSRLGQKDAAIDYLEQAEAAGLKVHALVLKDPDLAGIRREPEVLALIQRLEHRNRSSKAKPVKDCICADN